jgi:toxin ParE1/3/4
VTKLLIRASAKRDIVEACSWYERQRPGLGTAFLHELDTAIARVVENPTQFPLFRDSVRRVLLARFPYAVYYFQSSLTILRVLHLRRRPESFHPH